MRVLSVVAHAFSRWIDAVVATVTDLHGWLAPPRIIRLVESQPGEFTIQTDHEIANAGSTGERIRMARGKIIDALPAGMTENVSGSRLELVLHSDGFLFRPLELPGRAAEFLEGVVRSQIDRLTPWTATEAAFGWSPPAPAGTDRFITTIAATALERVNPYLQAVAGLGVQSITVFTALPQAGAEAAPIKVLQQRGGGAVNIDSVRHALKIILLAAGIGAGAAVTASTIMGASLDAQQSALARRIASARAATGSLREAAVGSVAAAHRTLEQLKHEAPSGVIVLDVLSQVLPDNTYVTELRIEDSKLRLTGVTKNAPSLIGLLEQSGRFTHATFFAPTTQSAADPGEHFHIEADIQPLPPPRS